MKTKLTLILSLLMTYNFFAQQTHMTWDGTQLETSIGGPSKSGYVIHSETFNNGNEQATIELKLKYVLKDMSADKIVNKYTVAILISSCKVTNYQYKGINASQIDGINYPIVPIAPSFNLLVKEEFNNIKGGSYKKKASYQTVTQTSSFAQESSGLDKNGWQQIGKPDFSSVQLNIKDIKITKVNNGFVRFIKSKIDNFIKNQSNSLDSNSTFRKTMPNTNNQNNNTDISKTTSVEPKTETDIAFDKHQEKIRQANLEAQRRQQNIEIISNTAIGLTNLIIESGVFKSNPEARERRKKRKEERKQKILKNKNEFDKGIINLMTELEPFFKMVYKKDNAHQIGKINRKNPLESAPYKFTRNSKWKIIDNYTHNDNGNDRIIYKKKKNILYGYKNKNNGNLSGYKYDLAYPFYNGKAVVVEEKQVKIINEDFQDITKTVYDNYLISSAKKLTDQELREDINYSNIFYNLGVKAYEKGDNEEAIRHYKKSIMIDSLNQNAYFNLGIIMLGNEPEITSQIESLKERELDEKRYQTLNKKRISLYYKALPYLEKSFKLDTINLELGYTLQEIYKVINDKKKLNIINKNLKDDLVVKIINKKLESKFDKSTREKNKINNPTKFLYPVLPGCEASESVTCFASSLYKTVRNNFNFNTFEGKSILYRGRIMVDFMVNKQGLFQVYRITARHISLIEEAERVMKLIPKMTPAKTNGNPVNFTLTLPITIE